MLLETNHTDTTYEASNLSFKEINKLRGGYYTPKIISDFIADWGVSTETERILEPSCGDGVFVESLVNKLKSLNIEKECIERKIIAIEILNEEAKKAKNRIDKYDIDPNKIVQESDFLEYSINLIKNKIKFDLVVGNPPFIRYQDFKNQNKKRIYKLIEEEININLSGLTNSFIPFLLLSTILLSENGRLGMVIPIQLFQVNYAKEARKYLSKTFPKLTIITFNKLLFTKVQQEVVILLGEKRPINNEGIKIIELENEKELYNKIYPIDVLYNTNLRDRKKIDHSDDKWTKYFLNNNEIETSRSGGFPGAGRRGTGEIP